MTNGVTERAVRRIKEGTSAVLLQSGSDEKWWADSMDMLLSKAPYEQRVEEPFKEPVIPFGSMIENHPISAEDESRLHQVGKKVWLGISAFVWRELGQERYSGR